MTTLGGGPQGAQTFQVGALTPDESANLTAHGYDPAEHVALSLGAVEGAVAWGMDPHGVYTFAQMIGRIPSAAITSRSGRLIVAEPSQPLHPLLACIRLVVPAGELRVSVPVACAAWRVSGLLRPEVDPPEPFASWREVRPMIGTVVLRDCLTSFEAEAIANRLVEFCEAGTVRIDPINPRTTEEREPDAPTPIDPSTG